MPTRSTTPQIFSVFGSFCLYPSLLSEIDLVIQETFTVLRYEDKGRVENPDLWRYSSVHYDCQLPDGHTGGRYDDALKDLGL